MPPPHGLSRGNRFLSRSSVDTPRVASVIAAIAPAGPPPTTMTSAACLTACSPRAPRHAPGAPLHGNHSRAQTSTMRSMPEFLPFVRRWFAETFSEATRPQREGWEAIASGRDTLIVAPTGSGKTLAAFLWALDHLHRLGLEKRLEDRAYVVYVSPLRALNNDIQKNLRAPLAGIRAAAAAEGVRLPEVRVAVRTGDTLAAARQAMTRRPPHILITTPESLYILLTSERFRPALAHVRTVIVDEVHALMGNKRGAHLALSLERLQALIEAPEPGARPQRIGCSATVSPLDATLDFLTGATARAPVG